MTFLALAVLSGTGFALVMRGAQRCGRNVVAVGAINYVVATGLYAALWALGDRVPLSRPTLLIGLAGGACYVMGFLILMRVMSARGVALAAAAERIGVLVPVVMSVVIWGERPTAPQVIGIVLAVAALPLVGLARTAPTQRGVGRRELAMVLALVITGGGAALAIKGFQMAQLPAERDGYFLVHFGTAMLCAWTAWGLRWRTLRRMDLPFGVALGIFNALVGITLLLALERLPGSVVFPVLSALTLALVTLLATLVWREPLGRLGALGLGLTLVATALIGGG